MVVLYSMVLECQVEGFNIHVQFHTPVGIREYQRWMFLIHFNNYIFFSFRREELSNYTGKILLGLCLCKYYVIAIIPMVVRVVFR